MSNSTSAAKTKKEMRQYQRQHNSWKKAFHQHGWLYAMLVPGVVWMLIFCYLPMGGLVMAFENFSPYAGNGIVECLVKSPKVGFDNFRLLFTGADFFNLLRNTLAISFANLLIAFPMPIILALILNELRCMWFKRFSQTLVYIPHFISLVIVATLTFQLFNSTDGVVYNMIAQVVGRANAPDILSSPKLFVPLILGQNIWKETGYGTIIYLAALTSVDPELLEAAKIDGANRWNLLWHITLPTIRSTIVIMLIMKVGSLLNTGYEQIFLMQNAMNRSVSEVFDTYVYNRGVSQGQYSLATTAGLFKSIVSLIMVLGANKISKMLGETGLY